MISFIDTHAHLDFPQFNDDVEGAIMRAKDAGVVKIINVGCNLKSAKNAIKIAEKYDNVFASVGVHPNDVRPNFDSDFKEIETLAEHKKVVAIGECGFDFFRSKESDFEAQEHAFKKHVDLAKRLNKPVIIHFRDARDKGLKFLKENHDFKFVLHCFSEDINFADQVINLGGMISFTGIVTFQNAKTVHDVAVKVSLENMMIETDSPFLAPQKHRGKRCEPAFVVEVAKEIAKLKGVSLDEVARVTTANAEEFFGV